MFKLLSIVCVFLIIQCSAANYNYNYGGGNPVSNSRSKFWRYTSNWAGGHEGQRQPSAVAPPQSYGGQQYGAASDYRQQNVYGQPYQPYYGSYIYSTPRYWVDTFEYELPLPVPKKKSKEAKLENLFKDLKETLVTLPPLPTLAPLPTLPNLLPGLFDKIKEQNAKNLESLAAFFKGTTTVAPPVVAPIALPLPAPAQGPVPILVSGSQQDTVAMKPDSNTTGEDAIGPRMMATLTNPATPTLTTKSSLTSEAPSCATGEVRAHPQDCTTFQYCLQGFWLDVKCTSSSKVPSVGALQHACKC